MVRFITILSIFMLEVNQLLKLVLLLQSLPKKPFPFKSQSVCSEPDVEVSVCSLNLQFCFDELKPFFCVFLFLKLLLRPNWGYFNQYQDFQHCDRDREKSQKQQGLDQFSIYRQWTGLEDFHCQKDKQSFKMSCHRLDLVRTSPAGTVED